MAGVRKEKVKVEIEDGNVLQISGERTKQQENRNDKGHRVERRRGSFTRRFRLLLEKTNAEEIKFTLKDGLSTVTVPKNEVQLQTSRNVRSRETWPG